jgi:SWI/SNF-related matrix-associated actin-dependent regulator of chromatin subfamily A3
LERERWEDLKRSLGAYSTSDKVAAFTVDVNVRSLRHHADKIGHILLRSSIFLQYPAHLSDGEMYYNPQLLKFDGFRDELEEVMSEPDEATAPVIVPDLPAKEDLRPSATSNNHVESILSSLSHREILHEIRTDTNRIKSELMG